MVAMAMASTLFRLPCYAPSRVARPHVWVLPGARRRRADRVVASYAAADSASFSSSPELPRSGHKQKSVAGVAQTRLVDPWLLADRDSRFAEFFGVQIHYKIAQPPSDDELSERSSSCANTENENGAMPGRKGNAPAVLLHGFGASLFSWQRVLKPLAAILGSSVVAFDRPAFGLTGRPKLKFGEARETCGPNPYSLEFSAKATLSFVDFLHAQQSILIGHSAGSLVALQAYLDCPEKVAAIILIAPAITAPLIMEEVKKATTAPIPVDDAGEDEEVRRVDPRSEKKFRLADVVSTARNAIRWVLMQVFKVLLIIKAAVQALFETFLPKKFVARVESAIRSTRERLVTAVFRSSLATAAVRVVMDRFGTRGVRLAWYDPEKADKYILQGYTKPLQCKDWERALLEFVLATTVDPSAGTKPKDSLVKRLKEVTCPVLVVTGDTDRLVPAWNSRRLAAALPNAEFEVIKKCGHVPQEETPDELLTIIERFLSRTFSSKPIPVPT